jgi:chromosomal replication initiation ATPase DnaA
MIPENCASSISIREIQQTVAMAFNLSVRDMVSSSRGRQVTCARHIAMYLSREMAARSIAGSQSHGTVSGVHPAIISTHRDRVCP